jgi:hypothetical protein
MYNVTYLDFNEMGGIVARCFKHVFADCPREAEEMIRAIEPTAWEFTAHDATKGDK